jgi:glycosyltransferase involved in cell wall biosynthesis
MNKMKRALIFSTAYYPFVGGAEVAIKEITDRLPAYEWDIVTAKMESRLLDVERMGPVNVHRVGLGFGWIDKFLLPILGTIKAVRLQRDTSYTFAWCMMASQASIAASFYKLLFRNVPMVLTLQEGDEESHLHRYALGSEFLYRLFVAPWHRLIFKLADHMTVISSYLKERAKKIRSDVSIDVIPNGVDLNRFKKIGTKNTDPGETILITTSRLVKKNAIGDVIDSMKFLPDNVQFWILGSGELESELRLKAKNFGIDDRIKFFGHVGHGAIVEYMSKADIFIRPSLSEGLGNSFLEAMAMELPVIATPVGGIPDFIANGETGLFCNVSDPRSIADCVRRLIEDRTLRNLIVKNAYEMVATKYDWNNIAKQMESEAFNVVMNSK